jgi:protein TonB
MLTHKTQPIYPPIAKSARVQGTIVLQATISKSGGVDNIHVVSGPVMLRQAAVDAVKTWHYRPYMLNNSPTEVETTINVIFALGG